MSQEQTTTEAISLLQQLGLQEYEARCFIALNRLPTGTAKEIHEISEVPRTRVYDAIRVLESEGLVEVQHSSPQVYRAVSVAEATQTLRKKYDDRIEDLEIHLKNTETRDPKDEKDQIHEVWSVAGRDAIESRMHKLIDDAESEIALLIVDEQILSDSLFDSLHDATDRDLALILGGQTEQITEVLDTELPSINVFTGGIDWLMGTGTDQNVSISRILLVDRETLLIGSHYPAGTGEEKNEQAIFARGLENGVVVLLRRLVTAGLVETRDPGV